MSSPLHAGPGTGAERIAEIENVLRELGSIGPTCTNWLIAALRASSDREAALWARIEALPRYGFDESEGVDVVCADGDYLRREDVLAALSSSGEERTDG